MIRTRWLWAWGISHGAVVAVAIVASFAIGYRALAPIDPSVPKALQLIGAWDTTWYADIVRNGYAPDRGQVGEVYTNLAFFPLFPILAWPLAAAGLSPFAALLAISTMASLTAFWVFHRLTTDQRGSHAADRAVWVLALLPPTLVLSLVYTEALALTLAVAAAWFALRNRYLLAGATAAAAAVTRPTGILVALLVAHLALAAGGPLRWRRALAGGIPAVLALVAFAVWMHVARGAWDLPLQAQEAWKRGGPGIGILEGFRHFDERWDEILRDVGFGVLFAWLLVKLWREHGGLRSPWVLYSAAALALPLATGSVFSLARFGVLAFPLVWPLADWTRERPQLRTPLIVASIVVTAAMVCQLTISSA